MRHLFLAPLGSAFGEVLQGLRLARSLAARGDEIFFAGLARMEALVASAGTAITFGRIDLALPRLDRELPGLIRRLGVDTLVLVDAAAVGKTVNALGLEPAAFTRAEVPVVALDCWDLPRTPCVWNYGSHSEILPLELHTVSRRLVPVPIGAPDTAGGYDALPEIEPLSAPARDALRLELGLSEGERLILWPSASWQHPENQIDTTLAARAAALPRLVLPRLARLPGVRVLHVGPLPWGDGATLLPSYRHVGQVAPARFAELVGAVDLLLGFNAVATSLATALATRTPVLLATSPTARAWPLDLDDLLVAPLARNPLYHALDVVDLRDETAFAAACHDLLFRPEARAAQMARQDAYRALVRLLPTGDRMFFSALQL